MANFEVKLKAGENDPNLLQHRVPAIMEEARQFSARTFGNPSDRGPAGALLHLQKEAKEATEASPEHLLEELADCQLLVWDAMWRAGIKYNILISAVEYKTAVNHRRNWGPVIDGKPVEHVRPADTKPTIGGVTMGASLGDHALGDQEKEKVAEGMPFTGFVGSPVLQRSYGEAKTFSFSDAWRIVAELNKNLMMIPMASDLSPIACNSAGHAIDCNSAGGMVRSTRLRIAHFDVRWLVINRFPPGVARKPGE